MRTKSVFHDASGNNSQQTLHYFYLFFIIIPIPRKTLAMIKQRENALYNRILRPDITDLVRASQRNLPIVWSSSFFRGMFSHAIRLFSSPYFSADHVRCWN